MPTDNQNKGIVAFDTTNDPPTPALVLPCSMFTQTSCKHTAMPTSNSAHWKLFIML